MGDSGGLKRVGLLLTTSTHTSQSPTDKHIIGNIPTNYIISINLIDIC